MSKDQLQDFEARVKDPDAIDPALISLQHKAIKDLQAARKLGRKTDMEDALAVAKELDALRLVL